MWFRPKFMLANMCGFNHIPHIPLSIVLFSRNQSCQYGLDAWCVVMLDVIALCCSFLFFMYGLAWPTRSNGCSVHLRLALHNEVAHPFSWALFAKFISSAPHPKFYFAMSTCVSIIDSHLTCMYEFKYTFIVWESTSTIGGERRMPNGKSESFM